MSYEIKVRIDVIDQGFKDRLKVIDNTGGIFYKHRNPLTKITLVLTGKGLDPIKRIYKVMSMNTYKRRSRLRQDRDDLEWEILSEKTFTVANEDLAKIYAGSLHRALTTFMEKEKQTYIQLQNDRIKSENAMRI